MYRIIIIFTLFIFFLACESKKTASYYVEHPDEMKEKMLDCKEDAAKMLQDPDCINAAEAWNMRFFGVTEKTDKKINHSKQITKNKNSSKGLLLLK